MAGRVNHELGLNNLSPFDVHDFRDAVPYPVIGCLFVAVEFADAESFFLIVDDVEDEKEDRNDE